MSARTSFCALALAAAGAWLMLPPRPTTAQAPAGESTDQRLRRLEEKIDKLTAAIAESREAAAKPAPVTEREVQLIMSAQKTLRDEVEVCTEKYLAFCGKAPVLLYRTAAGGRNMYLDRLAKVDARRGELQLKMIELQEELGQVNAVLQKEAASPPGSQGQAARALMLLLKRKGVDLGGVRKRADQGDVKEPNDVELLKVHGDSLTAEVESTKAVQRALDALFEKEQKDALELITYEMQQQRLKEQCDS
jgi:hypothetical protein